MGLTYIQGTVRGLAGREATVEFLVDSGAKYTLLPETTWKTIGLSPKRRMTFTLADGSHVERDISECYSCCPRVKDTRRLFWVNQAMRPCWELSR